MPNPLADRAARQRFNKALRGKGVPAKACCACFAVKALTQFSKHPRNSDGRQSRCRDCDRATAAKWRSANADHTREYKRRWYEANADAKREYKRRWDEANPEKARAYWQRRRARKAAATVEDFTPAELFAAWDDAAICDCYLCGLPFGAEDEVHLEHVIPLARGGTHEIANILPAHDRCNQQKNAADPFDAWHRIQRDTHGDAEAEARMRYVQAHTA